MKNNKTNFIFLLLFFISNIFLLLNYQGVYWDDWVAYDQEPATLALFFGMIQHGIKGDFFLIISEPFNHIYLFRIFVFIAYLLIGYFTYTILLSTKLFNAVESKLIAFISIIIPINTSTLLISIAPFLFPILLFYFSFFLLVKYYQDPNKYLKIIILFLFFISFSTNSLLVFYGIVLLYLFYMDNERTMRFSVIKIKNFIVRRIDFILLPIVYFMYKQTFFKTYGIYEVYNKITIEGILNTGNLLRTLFNTMTIGIVEWLSTDVTSIYVSLIFATLSLCVINLKNDIFKKNIFTLFILSITLFILASSPYLVVGKIPVLEGWNSRFSILLGISIAMFSIACIALISKLFFKYKNKAFIFMISFIIILMVSKSLSLQYKLLSDWFYQVSIIENLQSNDVIKKNTTFIVHNHIKDKLAYHRNLTHYEWNGLLKKAFGDTKRLMIIPLYKKHLHSISVKQRPNKQYNFYEWDNNQNTIDVTITSNIQPSFKMQAKSLLLYIFNYDKFLKYAKKLTTVSIGKTK